MPLILHVNAVNPEVETEPPVAEDGEPIPQPEVTEPVPEEGV